MISHPYDIPVNPDFASNVRRGDLGLCFWGFPEGSMHFVWKNRQEILLDWAVARYPGRKVRQRFDLPKPLAELWLGPWSHEEHAQTEPNC